jgi:hypothetical protein
VKATGPDATVTRASPFASVVIGFEPLLTVPGASGAFQRTEAPARTSPDCVFTVTGTTDLIEREPVTTVAGM